MNRERLILFPGILLLLVSYYMAFFQSYNHFYEFTLAGLFLIFYPFLRERIEFRGYWRMYRVFLLAGLVADLFLGLYLTRLWFYSYSHLWEYILLYLWIYPFGGILMVQSFVFLDRYLPDFSHENKVPDRFNIYLFAALGAAFVVLAAMQRKYMAALYAAASIAVWFLVNTDLEWWTWLLPGYLMEKLNPETVFESFRSRQPRLFALVSLNSFGQMLLHEVPNVYAQQWVYQNMPFPQLELLGVPAAVIVGWVALTLIPVSIYYRIR